MFVCFDSLTDLKIKQLKQEFVVFIIVARENSGDETEISFKTRGFV